MRSDFERFKVEYGLNAPVLPNIKGKLIGLVILSVVIYLGFLIAVLAGCTWVVVYVLQSMGVL